MFCLSQRSRILEKESSQISGDQFACRFVLFSSLCLQETMTVPALSRLLETVAKSTRHATAMSTILARELCQARCDAAIATSKLLLENSGYKLRNDRINAKSLFDNKIKKVAKAKLRSATAEISSFFLNQY